MTMLKVGDRAVTNRGAGVVISNEEARRILGGTFSGLGDPLCLGVRLDPGHETGDPVYTFTPRERGNRYVWPEPVRAEVKSQHPADLKPRGVKAPLGLIPWSVVPDRWAPPGVEEAARDAGVYPDGGKFRETVGMGTPEDTTPGTVAHSLLAQILSGDLGEFQIEDAAEAFGYGAAKYAPWNWQTFTWDRAAETEYWGAICRHLRAVERGEERASDSGVRHLGHAAAGCMIWIWHEARAAQASAEAPAFGQTVQEPRVLRRPQIRDRVRVRDTVHPRQHRGLEGRVRSVDGDKIVIGVNGRQLVVLAGEVEVLS